jgi:hypothetical protein
MAKARKEIDIEVMSKADARVAIAKDVIAQLRRGKLNANVGIYVDVQTKGQCDLFEDTDVEKNLDLRDVLKKRMASCKVCAKGAIFISTVMRFDNLPVAKALPIDTDDAEDERLAEMASDGDYRGFFTPKQLDLIEYAFECGMVGSPRDCPKKDAQGVHALASKFPRYSGTGKERLVAMMKNIIDNAGTFKPAQFVEKYPSNDE